MYEIMMQSDVVEQVSNNFLNESQEISDMLSRINGYVNELSTSWVGDSKNKFVEELNSQTVNNLNAYVEHFSKLGNSLSQIVSMFQQTDASDGGISNSEFKSFAVDGNSTGTGGPISGIAIPGESETVDGSGVTGEPSGIAGSNSKIVYE